MSDYKTRRPGCPNAKADPGRSCPVGVWCANLPICQKRADLALLGELWDLKTLEQVEERLKSYVS